MKLHRNMSAMAMAVSALLASAGALAEPTLTLTPAQQQAERMSGGGAAPSGPDYGSRPTHVTKPAAGAEHGGPGGEGHDPRGEGGGPGGHGAQGRGPEGGPDGRGGGAEGQRGRGGEARSERGGHGGQGGGAPRGGQGGGSGQQPQQQH